MLLQLIGMILNDELKLSFLSVKVVYMSGNLELTNLSNLGDATNFSISIIIFNFNFSLFTQKPVFSTLDCLYKKCFLFSKAFKSEF